MKAKVFKYKSDGNTVVASYMELEPYAKNVYCLLYTSDAADEEDSVDLGGRRINKKKKKADAER